MAMSRALRDVMRGENGVVPKKPRQQEVDERQRHAAGDQVKRSPGNPSQSPSGSNKPNTALRYRGD